MPDYTLRPPKSRYTTAGRPSEEQRVAFRALKAWEANPHDLSPLTPKIREAIASYKAGEVILPRGRFERSMH